jgi:hypothetical protein
MNIWGNFNIRNFIRTTRQRGGYLIRTLHSISAWAFWWALVFLILIYVSYDLNLLYNLYRSVNILYNFHWSVNVSYGLYRSVYVLGYLNWTTRHLLDDLSRSVNVDLFDDLDRPIDEHLSLSDHLDRNLSDDLLNFVNILNYLHPLFDTGTYLIT